MCSMCSLFNAGISQNDQNVQFSSCWSEVRLSAEPIPSSSLSFIESPKKWYLLRTCWCWWCWLSLLLLAGTECKAWEWEDLTLTVFTLSRLLGLIFSSPRSAWPSLSSSVTAAPATFGLPTFLLLFLWQPGPVLDLAGMSRLSSHFLLLVWNTNMVTGQVRGPSGYQLKIN